jgi:hypothetical protein
MLQFSSLPACHFSRCPWVLLILAVLLGAGCDSRPARVPVSGTVTIDGQPLTSGYVRFVPQHGRPASGPIDSNGNFKLTTFDDNDGVILGQHQVEVIAVANPSGSVVRYLTPVKYQDASTSGLQFTITQPELALKLELTWDGEKTVEETRINEGDVPLLSPPPDTPE